MARELRFGVVSESVPEGRAWLEHACRIEGAGQLCELKVALDAGPAAWGWQDQCWTLARTGELMRERFGVGYTLAGLDEDQIARWRQETWPVIKGRRRTGRLAVFRGRVRPGPEAAQGPHRRLPRPHPGW